MAILMLTFSERRFGDDGDARARAFREKVGRAKKTVLADLATSIVGFSPVDTGNYVLSHDIVSGTEPPPLQPTLTYSEGLTPNQPRERKHSEARTKLMGQIEGIPDEHDHFLIWNNAEYGSLVEYVGWRNTPPYYVYAQAAAELPEVFRKHVVLFAEALKEVG